MVWGLMEKQVELTVIFVVLAGETEKVERFAPVFGVWAAEEERTVSAGSGLKPKPWAVLSERLLCLWAVRLGLVYLYQV